MADQATNAAPASTAAPAVAPNTPSKTETNLNLAQPTPESQAQKAAEVKRIKQLKLKVDGKEFTEDLPFELEDNAAAIEYMQKHLQLARMGQKRANEASTYKKQLDEVADFLRAAQADPKSARALLKELNIDETKLIETIITEAEELAKKSPEQIEREKLEAELKQAREDQEKIRKDAQEKELQFLTERSYQEYNESINQAIETSTLPKGNPYVVGKVADYMLAGLKKGIKVDPKELMPVVQEEIQEEFKQMVNAMGVDAAEQLIGKDVLDKIRKKNLSRAKPPTPVNKSILDAGKKGSQKQQVKKPSTFKDFFGGGV